MNLTQVIALFQRAAMAQTPYPTWASFEEAFALIESDKKLMGAIAAHRLVAGGPSWESIKSGYIEQKSFVDAVSSAKVLFPLLQKYQMENENPKASAKGSIIKF